MNNHSHNRIYISLHLHMQLLRLTYTVYTNYQQ